MSDISPWVWVIVWPAWSVGVFYLGGFSGRLEERCKRP